MGGSGSGDWQNGRPLTVGRLRLDVRALVRAGLDLAPQPGDGRRLRASWTGMHPTLPAVALEPSIGADGRAEAVTLTAGTADGDRRDVIDVAWTRTGYGRRPWWRCPRCRRRVAILYAARRWTAHGWACRTCHGLAYLSTRQPADVRADVALRRAAAALGVTLPEGWGIMGIRAQAQPPRPPGMRRDTYARRLDALHGAHDAASDAWIAGLMGGTFARRHLAALEAGRR